MSSVINITAVGIIVDFVRATAVIVDIDVAAALQSNYPAAIFSPWRRCYLRPRRLATLKVLLLMHCDSFDCHH
jgi:hypothetical protein